MRQLKTALIVIDMQANYIGEKRKYKYYPQILIGKVNNRIATAVKNNELIIYVKQVGKHNKKPYVSDFAEGLLVVSNCIIEKERPSIFDNHTLLAMLIEEEISNIELIGIDGNCCVAASAIDAAKLGFSVVFPLNYIGIKSKERFSKTKEKLMKANVQIIEPQEENKMSNFEVYPIGRIQNNKNGTAVVIERKYIPAMAALEGFSHINIIWWFSDFDNKDARNTLNMPQPYRKAPTIMGVFATRSPIRPNPIALTTAEVINIDYQRGIIHIANIDANDDTPVLDIKPYTPSLDRIETPGVPEWCSYWPKSLEQSANYNWEKEFNF